MNKAKQPFLHTFSEEFVQIICISLVPMYASHWYDFTVLASTHASEKCKISPIILQMIRISLKEMKFCEF